MNTVVLPSKPHYPILDGLRGVAALIVVIFHILEAHSTSHLDLMINHGYLAVDFFFLLSGFVIGYAYDDRWNKMTVGDFFKRRLVRLQPLVIMGMIIGAICFYFQASNYWPMIAQTPVWQMLLVMLLGFTMLPLPVSMDIRGWAELHPLDGPAWSLFYEYIANILYALFVRKFSTTLLTILVLLAGAALIHLGLSNPYGDVIGGWSLDATQIHIGMVRMLYPFFAGLLLFRIGKLLNIKHAFLLSGILLVIVFAIPRVGGSEQLWMNGLYDSLSIILIFPLIVFIAASGDVMGKTSSGICNFLGKISYSVYITHYPIIYIYTAWVIDNKIPLAQALPIGLLVFLFCVALAYACLKLYDEPVRLWLKKKVLDRIN
ncbi:MAG: acyltransferase [Chitinophagaceae bacterium]|nr:acyltransferase [Chitinophagaceae bacterium]